MLFLAYTLAADVPEGTAIEFDVLMYVFPATLLTRCNILHISRLPKESFGFQCAGICIGATSKCNPSLCFY